MVAFTNYSRPRKSKRAQRPAPAESFTPKPAQRRAKVHYTRVDQSFTHGVSASNGQRILDLLAQIRGCDCEPYFDVFTYGRWQALGCTVRKGEKGIRIPTAIRNGEQKYATVFCRCQVQDA